MIGFNIEAKELVKGISMKSFTIHPIIIKPLHIVEEAFTWKISG